MNHIAQAQLRLETAKKKIYAYSVKDRVIINRGTINTPSYYPATVTLLRDGRIHVCCDDGYKAAYKPTASRAGLVGKCKVPGSQKRLKPIPVEHLSMWLDETIS